MQQAVFTDSLVAAYFDRHFICLKQDMEMGEGTALHNRFKITSYPTYIFFDTSEVVIYRTSGEFNSQALIAEGVNALTPHKQLPYLLSEFEKDVSDPENCLKLIRFLKKAGMEYSGIVHDYFATQSDNDLLSDMNWTIFANGTDDLQSRESQFVLQHRDGFAKIASKQRVERKLFYISKAVLLPLVSQNDTAKYFQVRQQSLKIGQFNVDSLIFCCDLSLYKSTANWPKYFETAQSGIEKYAWNNNNIIEEISATILANMDDLSKLDQAIEWVGHAQLNNEEYSSYVLLAKLFRKTNQKDNAMQNAQNAHNMAVKFDWDHSEADKILEELR